jgi:hypothetical protein
MFLKTKRWGIVIGSESLSTFILTRSCRYSAHCDVCTSLIVNENKSDLRSPKHKSKYVIAGRQHDSENDIIKKIYSRDTVSSWLCRNAWVIHDTFPCAYGIELPSQQQKTRCMLSWMVLADPPCVELCFKTRPCIRLFVFIRAVELPLGVADVEMVGCPGVRLYGGVETCRTDSADCALRGCPDSRGNHVIQFVMLY